MTSELSNLIGVLSKFDSVQKPKCLNFIINYKQFIQALVNINSLIGLKEAKYKVYLQVKSFIVNYRRHGIPISSEKLNILLCGKSGCGKSKLGYYLAQLWAASGCIKHNDGKDIFDTSPKEQQQPNNAIVPKINDEEKKQLLQSLAIRESQIVNYRNKIQKTDLMLNEILTSFNNVRKKIAAKDSKDEKIVQSKLQIIKSALKDLRSSQIGTPMIQNILPITIPTIPGRPNTFENLNFPFNIFDAKIPPTLPNLPISPVVIPTIPVEPQSTEVKFIVVTKGDLIGKYQGHTEDRVRKLLNKYIGGVIMIDESYSLQTSGSDDYGATITTELVNFMSTHPGKIIFIFAGYRDAMNSLFKLQEGLSRRIEFVVDIDAYNSTELAEIFIQQLKEFEIHLDEVVINLIKDFFKKNEDKFPQYGGSTEKFAKCVKQILYSDEDKFVDALNDNISDKDFEDKFLNIDMKIIEKAFKLYLQNSVDHVYDKLSEKDNHKMNLMYI